MNEEQLTSLFPQRREITPAQLKLGSKAWRAYSASNPKEIESLLESDLTELPFLKSALAKHLQRFPSVRNGLGRVENLALELVAGGQHEFRFLFSEFGNREPEYGFGDAQLRFTRCANDFAEDMHELFGGKDTWRWVSHIVLRKRDEMHLRPRFAVKTIEIFQQKRLR